MRPGIFRKSLPPGVLSQKYRKCYIFTIPVQGRWRHNMFEFNQVFIVAPINAAMNESLQKHKQYLLTGVSHVIPFIACGGILIAFSIALAPMTKTGPDFSQAGPFVNDMLTIGTA